MIASPSLLTLRTICNCFHTRLQSTQDRTYRRLLHSETARIGFVGLGNMGYSMASNLIASKIVDSPILVFDIDKAKCKKLVECGAEEAVDLRHMATLCDVIITMLPNTQHVVDSLDGSSGIFNHAREGCLLIDSSTIDPLASQRLHSTAVSRRLRMIDAPVSGGTMGAAAGTLTFMVGGSESDLLLAQDVLCKMGKRIVHCGGPGAGGIAKLCNNLSLGMQMIATSEAMNLGISAGLDPKVLAGVLNSSTGRCWSSEAYNPVPGVVSDAPASHHYQGGFGTELMAKDLGLALDLANKLRSRVPLGAQAHQIYALLCDKGYGSKDFSAIYDFLKK